MKIQSYATFRNNNNVIIGNPELSLLKYGYLEIFSEWHNPYSDEKPKSKVRKIAENFKKADIVYQTKYLMQSRQPCLMVYAK